MKLSVPKIQDLAKERQTSRYLPLLFILIFNIQAFSKSFTEVHEKVINKLTTGEIHAVANSSTFVFPQVSYQSHLTIQ